MDDREQRSSIGQGRQLERFGVGQRDLRGGDPSDRGVEVVEGTFAAALLAGAAAVLRAIDPLRAAADYVETFDLQRRSTMYLTYWTAGDTRNRGSEMLAIAAAYRAAGVDPPRDEAPDYLPVVLEFAATVDPEAGRRLLTEHRVPIDVLCCCGSAARCFTSASWWSSSAMSSAC